MIWLFVAFIVAGIAAIVVAFLALLDPNGRAAGLAMVVGLVGAIALFVGLVGLAWSLAPLVLLWIAGG